MNKRVQSPLGPGQGLGCGPPGQGGTVIRERPLLRVVDREGGDNYLGKFYGRIVRSQLPLILTNTLQSEQEKMRDLTLCICMYVCMYVFMYVCMYVLNDSMYSTKFDAAPACSEGLRRRMFKRMLYERMRHERMRHAQPEPGSLCTFPAAPDLVQVGFAALPPSTLPARPGGSSSNCPKLRHCKRDPGLFSLIKRGARKARNASRT